MSNKARQQRLNNKARKANIKSKQVQPVRKHITTPYIRRMPSSSAADLMARLERLSHRHTAHEREAAEEMTEAVWNRLFGADIRL